MNKIFIRKNKYVVGFKALNGSIAVSHYCSEKDVAFWRKEGYIVWER